MSFNKRNILIFGLPLKLFPRKKIVLFRSFQGQYNDNPKYISEKIHELNPEVKLYWALSNTSNKEDVPDYVKIIKYNSIKYYYYIVVSKIIVDNYIGIIYGTQNSYHKFLDFYINDKKQLNISTWHGTPLKKIGKDQKEYLDASFYSSSDFVLANNKYYKETMERVFEIHNTIMTGSPRNDILFTKNNSNYMKKKLGLPTNKRIVLFAPTFRDNLYESGEHQLKELKVDRLLEELEKKFGGKWAFVARMHNEVFNKFNVSDIENLNIINGNKHDDFNEYLSVSDVLITDYSGCIFDYLYKKKPCFLLTLDKENYEKNDRNFYFKLSDLPFPYSLSAEELYKQIRNFDEKKYVKKINDFIEWLDCVDDGQSSERVAKMIIDFYYNSRIDKEGASDEIKY